MPSAWCRPPAIAEGLAVDLFTLSRRMGTSLAMIDATYGHLAPDADERERTLLDQFDVQGVGGHSASAYD